jgi:ATP-dependent helicase/nuclease subunit A
VSRPPAVDQPARDAIAADVHESLVVEAGAGTGKTTVLVERIVSVLASGRASIDEIAVITFTEKAAAELAVRVRQRLEEARRTGDPSPEERERLDHAVANLYRARIETIHAFAAGLLRQRPVEAGLDPQFEVLDDLAATLAFDAHFDRWRGRLLEGEHRELTRALNRGFKLENLREVAEAMHAHRHVLPLSVARAPEPDVKGFVAELAGWAAELEPLPERCGQADEDRGVQQIGRILPWAARVAAAREDPAHVERLVLFSAPKINKGAGSQANWSGDKEGCQEMKRVIGELAPRIEELKVELSTQALTGVLPLVEEFATGFEHERRREGRADFDDLLIWARDLLRGDLGVREYFQRRYRCVLVDEFQDTDPIQAELVMYLVADGQDPEDWRELRPEPGKLVVVGDPKQSIYRFRRADIGIYDAIKSGALAGGLREIRQNFRSVPGLLSWVNRVFDETFDEEPGVQPANTRLEAAGDDLELDRPPVVVVNVPGEEKMKADARRELEARTLARMATLAVERERWPVRDRETREVRSAQWRDIAILVPARTGAGIFEDALGEAGIPFRHEGGRTFFVRQEIRELVSCLHAVDDPTDEVNLVAALRSPALGCSDEDLLLFTAAGGRLDYRVPGQSGPEALTDALTALHDLHRARRHASLAELVRRTLERTRMVELSLTLPDGVQTAANLLKVVEQARAFSSSGGGGLRHFTRWLSESSETEARESDAGVAEESDDLVRMITMHSAKGLEYPIVMLANLNGERNQTDRALSEAGGHRLELRVGSENKGRFETAGYADAGEREKKMERAERLRLLYVAITRARDHLVVPVVGERARANGLLKSLLGFLPEDGDEDTRGCAVYEASALENGGASPARGPEAPGASEERVADARRERGVWAVAREELRERGSRELPLVTATSIEKPWRPLSVAAEDIDGALVAGRGPPLPVGDALHRTMELVSLPDAEDLQQVARAVCEEADVAEHLDEVLAMARNCLASEVVQRALRSGRWWREVAFTVPGTDSAPEAGYTTGRVDLVFGDGDDLIVVDYKTDRVPAGEVPAAIEVHRGQAETYARGVTRATGARVRGVALVFARSAAEGELRVP